jgi:hypothetical protein
LWIRDHDCTIAGIAEIGTAAPAQLFPAELRLEVTLTLGAEQADAAATGAIHEQIILAVTVEVQHDGSVADRRGCALYTGALGGRAFPT